MNGQDSKRILWIDAVKGVCILLIMYSHLATLPIPSGWLAGYLAPWFILSGMFMHSAKSFSVELRDKARRLLFPYIFYGVGFSLLFWLGWRSDLLSSIGGLLYSRFSYLPFPEAAQHKLLGSLAPMWFLTSLCCATLLARFTINRSKYVNIGKSGG